MDDPVRAAWMHTDPVFFPQNRSSTPITEEGCVIEEEIGSAVDETGTLNGDAEQPDQVRDRRQSLGGESVDDEEGGDGLCGRHWDDLCSTLFSGDAEVGEFVADGGPARDGPDPGGAAADLGEPVEAPPGSLVVVLIDRRGKDCPLAEQEQCFEGAIGEPPIRPRLIAQAEKAHAAAAIVGASIAGSVAAAAEGLISAVAAEVMSPEAPAISPGPAPLEHGRRRRGCSGGSVRSHQGGEDWTLRTPEAPPARAPSGASRSPSGGERGAARTASAAEQVPTREEGNTNTWMQLFRYERAFSPAALRRSGFFRRVLDQRRAAQRIEVSVRDDGTSVEAMVAVLHFLEHGELLSGGFDALQLLAAARLLTVPAVVSMAVESLEPRLSARNIVRALRHSSKYSSLELQQACVQFLLGYLSSAAHLVSSVLDQGVDHTAVARFLSTLPRESFRELVVARRRAVLPFYRPRSCYSLCILKRTKTLDGNWACYKLYDESTNRFLLSAARDVESGHLVITVNENISAAPQSFRIDDVVAILEGNTFNTQYTMIDNGINCSRLAVSLPGLRRRELGVITYDTSLTGSSPRSIAAAICAFPLAPEEPPTLAGSTTGAHEAATVHGAAPCDAGPPSPRAEDAEGPAGRRPRGQRARWGLKEGSMRRCLLPGELPGGVVALSNVAPRWNERLGSFSLNFYSRVKVASKKNFQLTPPGNADDIVFLFGKLRRNTYVCDFKPPMSCVQAFMAALSAFEHRMGIS